MLIMKNQDNKEYELYSKPVYDTRIVYYTDGSSHVETYFRGYVDDYRYCTTHYYNWGRVDNGGGQFFGVTGSYSSQYEKKQNIELLKLGEKKMNINININLEKMKLVIFIILNILLLLMLFLLVKFI